MECFWCLYVLLHVATTSSEQVISKTFCREPAMTCRDQRIYCKSQSISIEGVFFEGDSNCTAIEEFQSKAWCCCGESIAGNTSQDQGVEDIISNACNNQRSCDIGVFFLQHSGRITIEYHCDGGKITVPTRTTTMADGSVSSSPKNSSLITSSKQPNASHNGDQDDINVTLPVVLTLLVACLVGAGLVVHVRIVIKRRRLNGLKQSHEYTDIANVSRNTDTPNTVENLVYINQATSGNASSYNNTTQQGHCNKAETPLTKNGDTNMYDTIDELEDHEPCNTNTLSENTPNRKRNSASHDAENFEMKSTSVKPGKADGCVDGQAPAGYDTVGNTAVNRHHDDDRKASTYDSITHPTGATGNVGETYDIVTRFEPVNEPLNETYDHVGRGSTADGDVYDHANRK